MVSWESVRTENLPQPPLLIIHGEAGTGKTTLAAQMPRPIFLSLDGGLQQSPHLRNVANFPPSAFDSYNAFLGVLRLIGENPQGYKTLVIDNASILEQLIWAEVARRKGKATIEDIGFGKGYIFAQDLWKEIITYLLYLRDQKGLMVVLIAHSKPTKQSPPDMQDSYTVWEMQLDARAIEVLKPITDGIFFARIPLIVTKQANNFGVEVTKVQAVDETRRLYCQPGPGFAAKSRYALPNWIKLDWKVLKEYLTGVPVENTATATAA